MSTFCSLPWDGVHINQNLEVFPCSYAPSPENSLGILNQHNLLDILNGNKMTKMRSEFLAGRMPTECKRTCGSNTGIIESMMTESQRAHIFDTKQDTFDVIRQFDFRAQNTCKLACSYCNSTWSSTIAAREIYDPLRITARAKQGVVDQFDLTNIVQLRLAGGEPLLIKDNIQLLEKVAELSPNCNISVDTGLADINTPVFKKLVGLKNVNFIVSIDTTVPQRFEYIRYGAKFDTVINNIKTVIDLGFPVSTHSVACLLTYSDLKTTLSELTKLGVLMKLVDPVFNDSLDLRHLPRHIIDKFITDIEPVIHPESFLRITARLSAPFIPEKQEVFAKLRDLDRHQSTNSELVFAELYKDLQ